MSLVLEKADHPLLVRAMGKGKFVRVNDSFKIKLGFDAAELAEKPFLDWIDPRDRTLVQAALENNEKSFFARHITRNGNSVQLQIRLAEHEDGLFVLGRCATAPTQLESDEVRSAQATVSGTLDAIARIIEEQNPGYKCSVLLVADGRFVFGAGPSLPDDYNSAVNGYAIGPNVGSCGTAIFWNTPVIVEDIQSDPLWSDLAALAKKAGVAACWSHPFVGSSGKVLGALALYSPEPRAPTTEQLGRLKAAARITGLAVERGRAEEELKRADQAIKVARNRLQATLNALPDLLFEVDSEGRIFSYHTHRTDLLAAPPEAFLGKRFADVLPPDAADAIQRAIDEAAQHGFSSGETYRLALPQGEHWFELAVSPMHADDKSKQHFVIISRDITERHASALALQDMAKELATSRDLLQQIIDTAPIRVFWKDREGRYLGCNPLFARDASKQSPAQLIGLDDYAMGWAAHADQYRADDQAVMQTGQSRLNYEEPQTTPDGKTFWLRTSKVPMRDASGTVTGLLGLYDDITEHKRSERRLALALDASRIQVWELDLTTGKLGYDGGAMVGLGLDKANAPDAMADWLARVHPDDRTRFSKKVAQALQTDGARDFDSEYRFDDNAGSYHWLQTIGRVVQRDVAGNPLLAAGYSINIDERKRSSESLRLAANVFTHAREGIIITDRDVNILNVNAAFSDITGYSSEDVLGKNPRILKSDKQDKAFYAAMWHGLQSNGYWCGEVWNRRKDGEVFAAMQTVSAVRDECGDVQNYIALFSDITTSKKYQAQLDYIAHFDALTGLANRLLLGDRLRQAMSQAPRRGQRVAVAYLDLDGFKAVNDTHGHAVGDQLLKALTQRMTQALRDGDTLGRLGGDEFVAVLVDLSGIEASVPILTRLLEAVAQPFPVGDLLLKVTASMGVTFYPQGAEIDADQLLRQADQAMYQAKQGGKNCYHVFDDAQDRDVRGRHETLEHIRQALAKRQFTLYYQPKVNMRTGELVGAEALIRWQHPQRGLLSPALFLPIVEDRPLAIDLGEWVIDTALTQMEAWHAEGLSIPVSVNVGALQLQQPDFVSGLRTLLSRHPGVNPGELELEILETSALEDFVAVTQVMVSCKELGVGFALDDFGTGYSSLTYLKQLPVGLLKVDQSFVRDMLDDPDDLAILEGVLGLASAFRHQVIAEGVETLAQGEMLLRLGCEWAQGYAIARPMPAHDLRRWVSTWDSPPAWKALKPISRDRLPVLFAVVEHRAWICAMVECLSGKSDKAPEQDAHQCRFGRWLDRGGRDSILGEGTDHAVDELHRNTHRRAVELMALKRDGRTDEVQSGISELHCLRDQLLDQLNKLY